MAVGFQFTTLSYEADLSGKDRFPNSNQQQADVRIATSRGMIQQNCKSLVAPGLRVC